VLASTQEGDFYVLVEELTNAPDITIDQTVRHYKADGTLVGIARVPIAERFTYVSHGVAVGPDRRVYALITRPHRADVIQLEFDVSLPEILPARPALAPRPARRASAAPCKRSRAQIRETAEYYINNTTFLNSANLNGPCKYRQRPTYLGTSEGSYISVPYDWGGFDSVLRYNNLIRTVGGVYRAGDRKESNEPKNYTADCSRGVDCSGFVSRCWGLAAKEGTASLPNISTVIPASDLQLGDILNKAGKHVVIFDKLGSNPNGGSQQGVYAWESTQTNKFDRVVYHWWPWSRFKGYVPRRYKHICP
jgi:cell wall-associated NlpC family hydrolase